MSTRIPRRIAAAFAALALLGACSDSEGETDRSPDESVVESPSDDAPDSSDTDPTGPGQTGPGTNETDVPENDETSQATTLTPQGLGALAIGTSEPEATDSGLVQEWQEGCSLGGPGETTALLADPFTGQAYASDGSLFAILVISGPVTTEPGGVSVGMSRNDAIAAFAADGLTMTVDESTVEMWGEFFWSVSDGDADLFGGSINPDTGAVTAIATPHIPLCD